MKEHKVFVAFSADSFDNARLFRDTVESGDFSHDYGRYVPDDEGSVRYRIAFCLANGDWATDCVRMEMPGLVLLEYWNQAYCLARDNEGIWHACWVDEEFGAKSQEALHD